MPLIFADNRIPHHWDQTRLSNVAVPKPDKRPSLEIAFVNNMPDAAVEDTEAQFFQLLESAAKNTVIRIELYSLPHLPRAGRALEHLDFCYRHIDLLWNKRCDGLIVTGTEPHQPNLRNEPYWPAMVDVLDWAEHNTTSTVLSCLAAHAGVLYSDGIERQPLARKQFGVFEYKKVADHSLLAGASDVVQFPHSRWNEVRADALVKCGYSVLTESKDAGVDVFLKRKGKSLFVHFQGHPEYQANTLLKEYRRDVRRFLRGEKDVYPNMPTGYFAPEAEGLLQNFRSLAMTRRDEDLLAQFPDAAGLGELKKTWQSSAELIYDHWLQHLAARSANRPELAGATHANNGPECGDPVRDRGLT